MRAIRAHQDIICGRRETKCGLQVGLGVALMVAGMSTIAYAEPSRADTWVQATDQAAWSERQSHAAVSFGGKLWVLGGRDDALITLNDVWYSSDGATWTLATASAPWPARGRHGAVVFDNKMWVLGGYGESVFSNFNDVWCSSDGVTWNEVTSSAAWSPRYGLEPVVFDGKIWVLGGRASGSYKNDVWYSEDGATWTMATSNAGWPPNASGGTAAFDGKMWVMGGWSPPVHRNEVWASSDGVAWSLQTSDPGWWPRGGCDSVVADGMLWFMGGGNDRTWPDIVFNDVWTTSDGANWVEHISSPADWPARGNHRTVVHDDKIWVLGGYDQQADTHFYDVWYLPLSDNEPPVITCSAPVVLWSPNHELADVSSTISVQDPDGDDVTLSFRVFSDESETPETGDGTGRHAPDFKDEHDGGRGLLVRAERRGPEDGRFYVFLITADDGNGGVTTAVCQAAVVPHDQDQASLADVLAQANAAASTVQGAFDGGATLPPAGLYEHGLSDPLGPKQ